MMRYQIDTDAKADLDDIWEYTFQEWGEAQADKYLMQLDECIEAILNGVAYVRTYENAPSGLKFHRCQHHYIFFVETADMIIVSRVLHEKRDFGRHLRSFLD